MMRSRNRWLLRLAAVLVAGLIVLLWYRGDETQNVQNVLTVENRSGQSITLLKVTSAGETRSFRDVAPGATVTDPMTRKQDRFKLEFSFADGSKTNFVYVPADKTDPNLIALPKGEIVVRPKGKN